jgi:DNA-binding MurR/RpiR family transcriptional regulator
MQALKSSLSRTEQQVVDYIIANPAKVIYLSVAKLAEYSNVSDATVVRTCQKLGFNGFQDLKVTLAQDIVTPLQNIHEEICDVDDTSAIVDKVFQGTLHAINFTHSNLKKKVIEQAVETLLSARSVMIIGLGNSHSAAIDLHHKLTRLGILSVAYTDSLFQMIASSTLLNEHDVLFAISHSGRSMDIVDAVQMAKNKGVRTISLTNFGISPLSKISDIQLFTASKDTRFRFVALSSRVAQMAIIDVLYTILATRLADETAGNLNQAMTRMKY